MNDVKLIDGKTLLSNIDSNKDISDISDVINLIHNMIDATEIPMKPILVEGVYPSGQYECPVCGCSVTSFEVYMHNKAFGDLERKVKHTNCPYCHQLIDWN